MSLENIRKMRSERGFTIVELLIVVVIIAILAAIVVVAYNGITNRAKATKAQSAAATVAKKAEAYNALVGSYQAGTAPTAITGFNTAATNSDVSVSLQGSGIRFGVLSTAPTDENTVEYIPCGGTGAKISYWDYSATTPAKATQTVGSCGAQTTPWKALGPF